MRAARVLTQHQFRVGHTYGLRRHDFVSQAVLEHAILMNAGFVRKCVTPDDGLVRLHWDAGNFLQQLAGGIQLLGSDTGQV